MKTQLKRSSHFALRGGQFLSVVAACALLASGAQAAIISVSFDGSSTVGSPNFQTTHFAGAPGVRVDNWNPWYSGDTIMGDAGQTVVDDTGATVAGFTTTKSGTGAWAQRQVGTGSNDPRMFGNLIDVYNGVSSVAVSGVPYAQYDVYAYMYDDSNDRAGSFNIGSTTYFARGIGASEDGGNPLADGSGYLLSTDTTQGAGTDIDQGNYVKFSGLTGASFTLALDTVNAGDGTLRNKVAGFQIVEIPEPSSLALLGLGLVGLLRRRR